MFYKYLFCLNSKKNRPCQSIFFALLGLLLWSSKSSASELDLVVKSESAPTIEYNCSEAKCLTLDENLKFRDKEQITFKQPLVIGVKQTETLYPNIWLGQGIDRLDPLPSKKNFSLYFANQATQKMTISSVVEHGLKKENPKAMLNQVGVWRTGPSLYWEISDNTIISSSILWGRYSDGNRDLQTYSRVDRSFGSFSLSADLSTASYEQDLEASSGYFSPSNYLLYSAEAAWKQKLFDSSTCKLALRAGEQKLSGDLATVYSFGSFCNVEVSTATNINFNYSLASVNGTESEIYHGFTGTVRFAL